MEPRRVLFLIPYPLNTAPSQRFRFEQYFQILEGSNIAYRVESFLTTQNWQVFYSDGKPISKAMALLRGFINRFRILPSVPGFDFIFIHREATPLGPPIFEWAISKLFRKKIIYDFDDAIWLVDRPESKLLAFLKWRSKVARICAWSFRVSCGNAYLSSYAAGYNDSIVINPSTIDAINWHNPGLHKRPEPQDDVVIGWTGSHSTLKYLNQIGPVLSRLESKHKHLRTIVIADKPPPLSLRSLQFIQWKESTEVDDLLKIHIGLMPLPNDEWTKGKCGFKLLQYMSLEIPAVASAVGVNGSIIQNGHNGFLANTLEEWEEHLNTLIINKSMRNQFGKLGREKVVADYSVNSNTSNFLSLFA